MIDTAQNTLMNISMPKFTIEYREDLGETCRTLGLVRTMMPEIG